MATQAVDTTPHTAAALLHLVPPEQRLTPARIFEHALPEFRIVILALALAGLAALVIAIRQQFRKDERGSTGSAAAYLSALVATAPLAGLAIAAYDVMKVCVGLVNLRPTPDIAMVAPAFAEAAAATFVGFTVAAVGAALRGWLAVSARTSGT